MTLGDLEDALTGGGLAAETADKFVENVQGVYSMPYGVALDVCVNGTDRLAPMVVEEPSVVAAASNAAKMIRAGGGFTAEMDAPLMISQVRGGGPRDLEVRFLGAPEDRMIVVHIVVDCRDAMGANLVNSVAEAIADRLAELHRA